MVTEANSKSDLILQNGDISILLDQRAQVTEPSNSLKLKVQTRHQSIHANNKHVTEEYNQRKKISTEQHLKEESVLKGGGNKVSLSQKTGFTKQRTNNF